MSDSDHHIELSGERFVPEYFSGEIAAEHYHRYIFAREFVNNGIVILDIAYGDGYGSSLLANIAGRVIGVDISRDALLAAEQKYSKQNIEFMIGSCVDIPLPSCAVDMIVIFETIEHIAEHDAMLRELKRVLVPGGLLAMSSPDKYRYPISPGYRNPFHVKSYSLTNFRNCSPWEFG
jgi:ubiquinone/menaquinone biosynthesis C-methylase UbiE